MIGKDELAEGARYNDALADEGHDPAKIVEELGINPSGALYVAEQRAARIFALFTGQLDEFKSGRPLDVKRGSPQEHILNSLTLAVYDGYSTMARALRAKEDTDAH